MSIALPKITRGYLGQIAELTFPQANLQRIGFSHEAAERITNIAYKLNARDLGLK